MMNQKELTGTEIEEAVAAHMNERKTGVMASLDGEGNPYTSVVPVVKIGHTLYAYLSETAPHYEFVKKHSTVDMMFAEDESQMASSFLRKRLSYRLKCSFVEETPEVVDAFLQVHGEMVNVIRKMDFHLVALQIQGGKIILGAGQAYFLNEKEEFAGQDTGTGRGHGKSQP